MMVVAIVRDPITLTMSRDTNEQYQLINQQNIMIPMYQAFGCVFMPGYSPSIMSWTHLDTGEKHHFWGYCHVMSCHASFTGRYPSSLVRIDTNQVGQDSQHR